MVYVWAGDDLQLQHTTAAPDDDTASSWEGVTVCGLSAGLRWIPPERVDRGSACPACMEVTGTSPPLAGQKISTP
jgi:hypothetical protein